MTTNYYTQEELERETARVDFPDRDRLPDGWSKCAPNPMRLLAGFPRLRLKEGFLLRAYQHYSGGNGNGIVWAMPVDAPYPPPHQCDKMTDRFLDPPRPRDALDEFMDAIESDGTPASYLAASMLCRELWELGAMWHGISWGNHNILYEDPITDAEERIAKQVARGGATIELPMKTPNPEDFFAWTWKTQRPVNWLPRVTGSRDKVTVTFFTYSGHGREHIVKHTDTYLPGSLVFKNKNTIIAEGPGGFIY